MEQITINAELLLVLESKRDWIAKIPERLPTKRFEKESFLWIDNNGNAFETGADFSAAEEQNSYPCKIYRTQKVSDLKK
jgi:hypothetical protein